MSKENNLTDFLTDVASAIKDKRGSGNSINAQDFSDEIRAIEPLLDTINITSNGIHNVKDYKNASVLVESEYDDLLKASIEKKDVGEITIPYGITKIGDYVFYEYPSSVKFTSEESIEIIGNYAFYRKFNSSGVLPIFNYNFLNVKEIGDYAFHSWQVSRSPSQRKEFNLPNCEKIGNYAFFIGSTSYSGYNNVTMNFPKCIEIGSNAFDYFYHYDDPTDQMGLDINLPECTKIGSVAFGHSIIRNFYAPKITEIPSECFNSGGRYDGGINGELIVPSEVISIGRKAFNENRKMTKIIFNNKCEIIEIEAFKYCEILESVLLNEGLKTIRNTAFQGCKKLTNIEIPSTVTNIEYNAFVTYGTELRIVMKSTTPPTIASSTFSKSYLTKIYVPKGTSSVYKSTTNWSSFADYIVEPNDLLLKVPTDLLNNENYMYSIDDGKTYNQFTNTTLSLEDIAVIKLKSITSDTTILIGTTEGSNDVGTISNSELSYATTSGTLTLYLTIQ